MPSETILETGHTAPMTDAAVDAAGGRVATCSDDGTIRIFELETNTPAETANTNTTKESHAWRLLTTLEGHTGAVVCISWAPPTHYTSALLSCGDDCKIILWSDLGPAAGWAQVYSATLNSPPWSAAWAPGEFGKLFAVGCGNGALVIFSAILNENQQQWSRVEFVAHPNGCCALSWAPALPPGALLMAPLESELPPQQVQESQQSQTQIQSFGGVPLAPPRLVTCGGDRSVKVWTPNNNNNNNNSSNSSGWQGVELPVEVEASWREVAWAPGVGLPFTYIAAGSDEGFVVVWSQDGPARGEWNCMLLPQQEDSVTKLSWSLVGTFLLVSCANGTASMWQESATSQGWERACELTTPLE